MGNHMAGPIPLKLSVIFSAGNLSKYQAPSAYYIKQGKCFTEYKRKKKRKKDTGNLTGLGLEPECCLT